MVDDQVAEDDAAEHAEKEPDAGAAHEIRLDEVARLVQLTEVGAAPGKEVHVAILDAREQQIVCRARRALHVRKKKVEPPLHGPAPRAEAGFIASASRGKIASGSRPGSRRARAVHGGKSGLRRAGCRVIPWHGDVTNRATETSPRCESRGVKRGNLHPEQHQIGKRGAATH